MNPEDVQYTRLTFDVVPIKIGGGFSAWLGDKKVSIPEKSMARLKIIVAEAAREILILHGYTRTSKINTYITEDPMTLDHRIIASTRAMDTKGSPLEGKEYYEIKGHSFRLDVPKENKP